MHVLVLWNEQCPSFGQNKWVDENGTTTVGKDTFEEILDLFLTAIREPYIVRAYVSSPMGDLNWDRGECADCSNDCEGCPHDNEEG